MAETSKTLPYRQGSLLSRGKHLFFWLSGASAETLERCPAWEQRKYVAFGATVLVPSLFAFIAASYAISTVTANPAFIYLIGLTWAFIILSIDRALLVTYRSFLPFHRRIGQFLLRFLVALLMGLTISHPLTLLLFKDTIASAIEAKRDAEIALARVKAEEAKAAIERKIAETQADVERNRTLWRETFEAKFLQEDESVALKTPSGELDPGPRPPKRPKSKRTPRPRPRASRLLTENLARFRRNIRKSAMNSTNGRGSLKGRSTVSAAASWVWDRGPKASRRIN